MPFFHIAHIANGIDLPRSSQTLDSDSKEVTLGDGTPMVDRWFTGRTKKKRKTASFGR